MSSIVVNESKPSIVVTGANLQSIPVEVAIATHVAAIDPHPQYATDTELAAAIATREIPVLLSVTDGQIVFTLPQIPTTPTATKLFIGGVKYEFLQDYTLSGYVLTWLGFRLVSGDRIQFYY